VLADYVFPNPTYIRGGNEKELCDAIVVFDDWKLIVQIKTADPVSFNRYSSEKRYKWLNNKIGDALRQLEGSVAAINKKLIENIENEHRKSSIGLVNDNRTFGLIVIDRPQIDESISGGAYRTERFGVPYIVIGFHELKEFAAEFSTADSLFWYLSNRAQIADSVLIEGGSELDVIAYAKTNPAKFQSSETHGLAVIASGTWDIYHGSRERESRERIDHNSYLVDWIIHQLRDARQYDQDNCGITDKELLEQPVDEHYWLMTHILARIARPGRRDIGNRILDKKQLSKQSGRPRFFCVYAPLSIWGGEPVYPVLFVVSPDDREARRIQLGNVAQIAAHELGKRELVAIMLPSDMEHDDSVDACMYQAPLYEEVLPIPEAPRMFAGLARSTLYEFPEVKARKNAETYKKRKKQSR